MWIGFIWLRINSSDHSNEFSRLTKRLGTFLTCWSTISMSRMTLSIGGHSFSNAGIPTHNYFIPVDLLGSRGSSVSIVADYRLGDQRSVFDSRQEQRNFPLTSMARPDLRPTQPPVQWVPGFLSQGQSAAEAWGWPLTSSSAEFKNE
jgi:hypothetical protein